MLVKTVWSCQHGYSTGSVCVWQELRCMSGTFLCSQGQTQNRARSQVLRHSQRWLWPFPWHHDHRCLHHSVQMQAGAKLFCTTRLWHLHQTTGPDHSQHKLQVPIWSVSHWVTSAPFPGQISVASPLPLRVSQSCPPCLLCLSRSITHRI